MWSWIAKLFIQELIEVIGEAIRKGIARRKKIKENEEAIKRIAKEPGSAKEKAKRMRDILDT